VEFFDGGIDLGHGTPLAGGGGTPTSTLVTAALDLGSHALRAVYRPSGVFLASSGGTTQSVVAAHPLTVTTLADAGPGSLREALGLAGPGDAVAFADGLSGTLTLTSGELAVGTTVSLIGPGAGLLTVDAGYASRVLEVLPGATVGVSGLTVSRGAAADGGGIANRGTLLLSGVALTGNYATARGGGMYNGGRVALTDSVLYGNATGGSGGAAYNAPGGSLDASGSTVSGNGAAAQGGGLYNTSAATLSTSTVAANSAADGGGVANPGGALTLFACALYSNGATRGGAIFSGGGPLTLRNSTVAQNAALGDGGGIGSGGLAAAVGLTNVTLARNWAGLSGGGGRGGGLFVAASSLAPALLNTLVANNVSGVTPVLDDVFGRLSAAGANNLVSDGTGMTGLSDGVGYNHVGTASHPLDPGLGPLQDNGGPTWTCALQASSLARGGGSLDYVDPSDPTDQRGLPRVVGGLTDIGAYQTQDYGL
jgi:hypothetical protein